MADDEQIRAEAKAENAALHAELSVLHAELAMLREHLSKSEQRDRELHQAQEALRESQRVLAGLMGNLPGIVYRCTNDTNWTMTFISEGCRDLTGYSEEAFLNPLRAARISLVSLTPLEDQQRIWDEVQRALERRQRFQLRYRIRTKAGAEKWVWEQGHGVYGPDGEVLALEGFITDITAQVLAEAERKALQDQIIDAQREALRELGTPLIPLADGVLVMPLVGAIDRARWGQLTQTLLDGISKERATTAILDITGIRSIDVEAANALIAAARAARLLGTEVLLSGVRPEVAQMLVGIGADLGGIETRSTLQSAVASVLEFPLADAHRCTARRRAAVSG